MGHDERADSNRPLKDDSTPARAKRRYVKPALQEYGSIAKLTQSGGSTKTEGGGGMMEG